MIHNDNVRTLESISRHLELEVECLEATKTDGGTTYVPKTSSRRTSGSQRKGDGGAVNAGKGCFDVKSNGTKSVKHKKRGKRGG